MGDQPPGLSASPAKDTSITGSKAQIVAEYAGGQWGLITSAQCRQLGVNANDLGRLTASGAIVRVIRGVYEVPDHAGDPTVRLPRAGWLALGADRFADERRALPAPDAVISRSTALALHHVAHPLGERPDIAVPNTHVVMHNAVHHTATRRALTWDDTYLLDGLPVMSVGRAINDLVTMKTAPPPHDYLVAALLHRPTGRRTRTHRHPRRR